MMLILLSEVTTSLFKRFLEKNTFNSKVNNWEVDIKLNLNTLKVLGIL